MEGDFLGHLLTLMLLDQQGFGHDFAGSDFIVVEIAKFVAFGKTALKNGKENVVGG